MKLKMTLAALCISAGAWAQQAIWGVNELVSPEINSDGTVTFRLKAPKDAEVRITGEFLGWQQATPTYDSAYGIWTYTTPEALSPELYLYHWLIDGVRVNDPSNAHQIRDTNSIFSVFLPGGGPTGLYAVNDVAHGTVSRIWYPTGNTHRRLTVYTPAGYETEQDTNYPVLYLLHGMGGDETAWCDLGRAAQILDNLIARGEAVPMIVVMPNGNIDCQAAPGEGADNMAQPTTQLPRTMNGDFEASFPDIVSFVESTYRVTPDKSHRAIAGLSMGGFHSLNISRQYPDLFDYVGLFSAAVNRGTADSEIYANGEEKFARQFSRTPKLYWIGIGENDFLYDENKALRALFDSKGYPYEYKESAGGHEWRNWRLYLSEFLPKLFR